MSCAHRTWSTTRWYPAAGTREFLTTHGRSRWGADRWRQVVVVAEEDYVVQYGIREGHWSGGSFRGVQIPAGDYTREVAFMYRLEGGRIAERWAVATTWA